jgi:hypothetical protein
MSKFVSSVARGVSNVVQGAVNVVKDVGKAVGGAVTDVAKAATGVVKSIADSKLGKAVLIAAAIYFGGAAIAGGYGSAAGGGSFFTGMGAGVSSAATSLSSAWTSAMAGEFAQAGSTLGSSWSTAGQAGAMTSPGSVTALTSPSVSLAETAAPAPAEVATTTGADAAAVNKYNTVSGTPLGAPPDQVARMGTDQLSSMQPAASKYSLSSGVSSSGVTVPGAGYTGGTGINAGNYANSLYNPASSGGVMSSIWNSPYTAPALISGGMQVGGAYIQGQAQEKQLAEQRDFETEQRQYAEQKIVDDRDRYNANVGAQLWDPNAQAPIYQAQGPAWDPYAEARALAAQKYAPAQTGLAAKYMNA